MYLKSYTNLPSSQKSLLHPGSKFEISTLQKLIEAFQKIPENLRTHIAT